MEPVHQPGQGCDWVNTKDISEVAGEDADRAHMLRWRGHATLNVREYSSRRPARAASPLDPSRVLLAALLVWIGGYSIGGGSPPSELAKYLADVASADSACRRRPRWRLGRR